MSKSTEQTAPALLGSAGTVLPAGVPASRPLRQMLAAMPMTGRWVFALLLLALLISPMLPLIYQAFIDRAIYEQGGVATFGNFQRLFADPSFQTASLNTLWFSIMGTIVSTLVGFIAALLLERLALPGRKTLKILFLAPIFVSALILALSWSMLYGPSGYADVWLRTTIGLGLPNLNSLPGMAVLSGVSSAPVSYLLFAGAMANIPSTLEDAARAAGASPFRAMMAIVVPLIRPSLLYCIMLNFVLNIDQLAVPLIIGGPARVQVLSTFLYDNGIAVKADYGLVSAAAVVMLILIQFFIVGQKFALGDLRRYTTVGGKSMRKGLVEVGAAGWLISGLVLLYILITTLIPSLFLILRSFTSFISPLVPITSVLTLDNFKLVLSYEAYVRSIINTLIVSAGGGFIATILTFFGGVIAYRSSAGVRRLVEMSAFIPRAIPGIVVGIGIFYAAVILPGGSYLNGTLLILIIAFTIRYYPTGFAMLGPSVLQIDQDMERAMRVAGGNEWRSIFSVMLPLLRPALIGCFLLYFVSFFKEYAAASFLFGPDTAVVGTTMLQLDMMGNLGPTAALSVIALVLTLPIAIFVYARD
ncbi:MAG TPA: iron ABC transporter permease [Devosiaceae bacterium]|jgi:iron(III) transport system permease protein